MSTKPIFDADLLRRYDRPGPRYTSYPTAPQFTADFDERRLYETIALSNGDPIPRRLSLYAHVPFCASPCFYCGCNRVITRDSARGDAYVERLHREIALIAPHFDRDREVIQLHFGGGTPNFLRPAQLAATVEMMCRHFRLSDASDRDLSIEIDPRVLAPADVAELARAGFNRASLGVQDFDPAVQAAVNRMQSVEETRAIIDACRDHGFRSVNVDLIYGLPRQTLAGFSKTLQSVLDARPDRLAIYGYAHLPQLFRPQQRIDATELPSPDAKLGLLQLAIDTLGAAGYVHIGMDHFALPGDDLAVAQASGSLHRNFMGYTTHAESDLVGFGVSAISHIGDTFSQNPRDLPSWEAAVDAGRAPVWRGMQLGEDDRIRADVIGQLMCHARIDVAAIERRHGLVFSDYFASALCQLEPLAADGLVEIRPAAIEATSRGRLLLRIVAMCFDAYLQRPQSQPARYSRAI